MEQGCLLQKDHTSKTYPISQEWLTDATLNTTSGTGFSDYSFRRFCERVVPTVEDEKGVRCKRDKWQGEDCKRHCKSQGGIR